jgi:FOG: FHA domain
MAFITDCGSTHGTYLNDAKLVTDVDTPLSSGDIIRFGVDVDRGQGK